MAIAIGTNILGDIRKTIQSASSDIGLGFNLSGQIVWECTSLELNNTLSACGGTIETGLYYKVGDIFHKIISLNGFAYSTFDMQTRKNITTFSNISVGDNTIPSGANDLYFGVENTSGNLIGYERLNTLTVLPTYIKNITINTTNATKNFYENGAFSYAGLQIFADYFYQLKQTKKETAQVYNYSVIAPNMSSMGVKAVQINVPGYADTLTYSVNVYGVVKVELINRSPTTNYKIGALIANKPDVRVSYGLSASNIYSTQTILAENIEDDLDTSAEGLGKLCTLTFETYTSEEYNHPAFTYNVYGVTQLSLSGSYATTFNTNETFNHNGLVVTATYGQAGTSDVSSLATFSAPNMAQVGTQAIEVSFGGKNITYNINVNGITNVRLNYENVAKRIIKGGSVSTNGLLIYYTCSNQEETQLALDSAKVNIDTSQVNTNEVGTYQVNVSVTHEGNTITSSFNVVVYTLTSLSLSGAKTSFYDATFSVGNLVVTANYSDGESEVLSANDYSVVTPTMTYGSHEVLVSATKGDTITSSYNIVVIADTPTEISYIESTSWKSTYKAGETFSSAGIKVYCNMASGARNVECSFSTNLDGQTLSADTTLVITVAGISPYTCSLVALYDAVSSVSFNTTSMKTRYKVGELIDLSGLTCTITYSHSGATTYTDITTSRTTSFTEAEAGTLAVAVSCKGQSSNINVVVAKLSSIAVATTKATYNKGESLDTSTLTITATYSDNQTENIPVANCTIAGRSADMIPSEVDNIHNNLTISYGGKSASLSLTIKCLSSMSINLTNNKITFNYSDPFSLFNKTATITYNNGDTLTGTITADGKLVVGFVEYPLTTYPAIGELIINKVENSYVLLTIGNDNVRYNFTTHCYFLESLEVDATSVTGATHYAGDTLDLSAVTVKSVYVSTDTTVAPVKTLVTEDCDFSMNTGDILSSGTTDIVVSYEGKNAHFSFNVLEVNLTSISADTSALAKALNSYVVGQRLSLTGLVLSAVFTKSSLNRQLQLNEVKYYIGVTEVAGNQMLALADNGATLKATFTYGGVTKEATIGNLGVVAKALSSIAVDNSSTHKTSFYIGDFFSKVGLKLSATYNDGEVALITSGFTTNLDTYESVRFTSTDIGSKTVTVTYNGLTTTYNANVAIPTIASVVLGTSLIDLSPTNGTVYSLSALVVKLVYSNGYEETITTSNWTSNVATVLNIGQDNKINTTPGAKNITITATNPYNNQDTKTTTLTISVVPNMELQAIRLRFTSEDYDKYQVGDTFNAKDLIVEGFFKDATEWQAVSGYFTSPELGSILRSGGRKTVKVTYADKGVVLSQEYTIVVSMPYETGFVETKTYKVAFNVASVVHEEVTITSSETLLPLFESGKISVDQNQASATYGLNIYTGNNANADCVGYMELGATGEDGSIIENAKLNLFDDPINPIDGDGNIEVTFPHYVAGYADRINKAHFGIIFNKRLFVSGNADYRNIDWRSEDFTYFSDLNYCGYGSEETAVTGYSIYRDGTLLVFKEGSNHESTIFTREAKYLQASSYDGNVVGDGELIEDAYPMNEVNANGGEGTIQAVNYLGETVILSKNGVKAVTSKETTYNNAKYTNDISTCINPKIIHEDLEKSFMFVYKERLLLKTSRGVYVGEYVGENFEWFFLDNVNAVAFFEINDELMFSDDKGNLNKFYFDESVNRVDKPRTYIGVGGALLTIANDKILVGSQYANKIKEGAIFHLLNHISAALNTSATQYEIHASMGNAIEKNTRLNAIEHSTPGFDQTDYVAIIDTASNTIEVKCYNSTGGIDVEKTDKFANLYYEGRKIYFDNIVGNTNLHIDQEYHLKAIENDVLDIVFKVMDNNDNEVSLTGVETLRISLRVSDLEKAKITNIEDAVGGAKQFQLLGDHDEILDLIYYNGRNGTYSGVITEREIIKSHFVSKAYALGSIVALKTIYLWIIANDTNLPSYMDVGYLFSRKQGDYGYAIKTSSGSSQFDFGETRFDKIQFTNDKLPHIYTKYKTLANVGAIRFIFKNYEGTNMVLSHFSLVYAMGQLMKGVK